jgi:tight adherence protein B
MSAVVLAASVCAGLATFTWFPGAVRRGPVRVTRRSPSAVTRVSNAWRHRRTSASMAQSISALTAALATELRSGQAPDQAWRSVLRGWSGPLPGQWVPGTDVVTVLGRWASVPGWGGLAAVAICWRVADATGSGLADALERVGEAMRHEHDVATEVHGQLTAVRATATVLATLPLVAVAMGHVLGAEPLAVLLGSTVGAACLGAGLLLALTGWWWLTHQADAVRRTLRW